MTYSNIYTQISSGLPPNFARAAPAFLNNNTHQTLHLLATIFSTAQTQLSVLDINRLCRKQEQKIIKDVVKMKTNDLLEQVAEVCHMGYDLRAVSQQELVIKFTNSLASSECHIRCEDASPSRDSRRGLDSIPDFASLDDDQVFTQHGNPTPYNFVMRNILDEYDHHLAWKAIEIQDF